MSFARFIPVPLVFIPWANRAPADEIVRAADYDAYWLWAGVKARPDLDKARTIYLLQGEVGPGRRSLATAKAGFAAKTGSLAFAHGTFFRGKRSVAMAAANSSDLIDLLVSAMAGQRR